jgi:hypothetical protein
VIVPLHKHFQSTLGRQGYPMKLLHVLAGLLVAVCVAGCTTTPSDSLPAATGPGGGALADKLLTEADLPAGYKSAPLPSLGADITSASGCPALNVKPKTANQPEATAAFAGGAIGSMLTETLRTVSDGDATKLLDDLAATPQTCAKFNAQTMGIKVEFTAAKADLPSIGDRTVAVRLVASASGLGAVVDEYLVAVKAGKLLSVVTVIGPGQVDRATVEAVMRKAWQKAAV